MCIFRDIAGKRAKVREKTLITDFAHEITSANIKLDQKKLVGTRQYTIVHISKLYWISTHVYFLQYHGETSESLRKVTKN